MICFFAAAGNSPEASFSFHLRPHQLMNLRVYQRISPSNFVEIIGFVVVDSALNAVEGPIVTVVQDGWNFEVAHETIVQKPGTGS